MAFVDQRVSSLPSYTLVTLSIIPTLFFDNSQGMTLSVMVCTWLTNFVEQKTLFKISQR